MDDKQFGVIEVTGYSIKAGSMDEALEYVVSDEFDPENGRVANQFNHSVWPDYEFFKTLKSATTLVPIVIDPRFASLSEIARQYFDFRGYQAPSIYEALAFLVSEVGELADAINTWSTTGWVRNNPENKHSDVGKEAGDVLMMLTVLLWYFNTDPATEMIEMMKKKGFNYAE